MPFSTRWLYGEAKGQGNHIFGVEHIKMTRRPFSLSSIHTFITWNLNTIDVRVTIQLNSIRFSPPPPSPALSLSLNRNFQCSVFSQFSFTTVMHAINNHISSSLLLLFHLSWNSFPVRFIPFLSYIHTVWRRLNCRPSEKVCVNVDFREQKFFSFFVCLSYFAQLIGTIFFWNKSVAVHFILLFCFLCVLKIQNQSGTNRFGFPIKSP